MAAFAERARGTPRGRGGQGSPARASATAATNYFCMICFWFVFDEVKNYFISLLRLWEDALLRFLQQTSHIFKKWMVNRPELSWRRHPPLKYKSWASQEDLAGFFFVEIQFLLRKKWICLEGAKNKLKTKKMRTDESFPVVRKFLKKDQSLRGKHRKYWYNCFSISWKTICFW